MNLDVKALKKIAKACREAGIKHYKGPDFEFTLTDDAPTPRPPRKGLAASGAPSPDVAFQSDSPTDEQLLFWSAAGMEDSPEDSTEAS